MLKRFSCFKFFYGLVLLGVVLYFIFYPGFNNIYAATDVTLKEGSLGSGLPKEDQNKSINEPTAKGQIGELCCSSKQEWEGFNAKDNQECESSLCYDGCFTNNPVGEKSCLIALNKDSKRYRAAGVASVCVKSGMAAVCPLGPSSIEALIDSLTKWIFYLAMIIAPLFIIIGAFMFLTAAGDTAKITKAKQIIIWACVGLFVILFARGILSLIKNIIGFV